jgi:hypothetical protein
VKVEKLTCAPDCGICFVESLKRLGSRECRLLELAIAQDCVDRQELGAMYNTGARTR